MEKRILVTDTHLGCKKANDHYLDVVIGMFQNICDYATENNIKKFTHLGDFFDNRKAMSLKTLHAALKIGQMLQDTFDEVDLLIGNHDLFYKDQMYPNSLEIFKSYPKINVIDEPTVRDNILYVPWLIEGAEQDLSQFEAKYCFGHFEINGAKMNKAGVNATGSLHNFTDFARFDKTLSGHFHTRGEYPHNVEYIGAGYHMDFNDTGVRGYYVWEEGNLDFVQFNDYPHYMTWVAQPDAVICAGDFKGKIVKIVFQEDFGISVNNQIIEDVRKDEPYHLFTDYVFGTGLTDEEIDEEISLMNPRDIHVDFIEKSEVPEYLDKTTMLTILGKLYDGLERKAE